MEHENIIKEKIFFFNNKRFMSHDILLNKNLLRRCNKTQVGYAWTSNSCYLDSVLWVLFSSASSFVDNKILFSQLNPETLWRFASCAVGMNDLNEKVFLEFQMMFRKVAYFLRCGVGITDCSDFRKLFRKWYNTPHCTNFHSKSRFHLGEQQEAQELLQFIFSLYGMNGQESYGAVSKQEFYYGVSKIPRLDTMWKFIYHRKDKKQSIVWNVSFQTLRNMTSQERNMKNFLQHQDEIWNISKQHKHCHFNAMRTVHSLTQFADLLVFSLERIHPIQQTISHFRIHLNQTLIDKKGKTLHLTGIICHHGKTSNSGHYTAFRYSKVDQKWYFYDDMNLPIQKIGSWENMKTIRHVFTHCVLVFYTKL